MTNVTFPAVCQFRKVLSNLKSSVAIPGPVSALILGNGSTSYDIIWRVKLIEGYILARSCPRCNGHVGIVPRRNRRLQAIKRRFSDVWLSTGVDTCTRQGVSPAGRHCPSFITLRISCAPDKKKAARNDPKYHYYRPYRAGVFASMVAWRSRSKTCRSSITHKTVGIRFAASVVRRNKVIYPGSFF